MTNPDSRAFPRRRQGSALLYLLYFVFALFIGILVVVYIITRQSNPVMLDEHGKPVAASFLPDGGQKGGAIRA